MANFTYEKYNSMPEQVEENKKNIKELVSIIKVAYRSTVDLSNSSVSVAISDTNANIDTVDGWLISQDGYLYKITGGDGVNLLLEFYTDLKGSQGNDGKSILTATINLTIGMTTVSSVSVLSDTPKLNDIVIGANGVVGYVSNISGSNVSMYGQFSIEGSQGSNGLSIRFSNTALNQVIGNSTTIQTSDIVANDDILIDDLIMDANGYIGKVFYIGTTSIDVRTIACITPQLIDDNTPSDETTYSSNKIDNLISSAGKTLYQHNLMLGTSSNNPKLRLQIINDDNTPFTSESFLQYLNSNGFVNIADDGANQKRTYMCTGKYLNPSNVWFVVTDINYYDIDTYAIFGLQFSGGAYSRITTLSVNSFNNVVDTIIEL